MERRTDGPAQRAGARAGFSLTIGRLLPGARWLLAAALVTQVPATAQTASALPIRAAVPALGLAAPARPAPLLLAPAGPGPSQEAQEPPPPQQQPKKKGKKAKDGKDAKDGGAVTTPSDGAELARLMRNLRHEGQAQQALDTMKDAPKEQRSDARVLGQRLLAMLDLRRLDEAQAFVDQMPKPQDPIALALELGLLRVALLRGADDALRARVAALAAERPDNADVQGLQLRLALLDDDVEAAQALLAAMRLAELGAWEAQELSVDIALARTREMVQDDELVEQALPLLEPLVTTAGHRGDLVAAYAQGLMRWQRTEQAETLLGEALAREDVTDRADLQLARADLLRTSDRLAEAVALYDEVLASHPDQAEALLGLARCKARHRDEESQALELLQRCLELHPEQVDALLVRAEIHEDQGDLPAAEADLRAVLAVRPNHLKACWRLSRVLARQGQSAEVDALVARYEARKAQLAARATPPAPTTPPAR